MSPETYKAGALPAELHPHADLRFCVTPHLMDGSTALQRHHHSSADWMAWALWVAVVSAQLAASDRGCIRARALRLSALLSSDDYGSSVMRRARGLVLSGVCLQDAVGTQWVGSGPCIGARTR